MQAQASRHPGIEMKDCHMDSRELLDREEIRELTFKLAWFTNEGEGESAAALFVEDGVFDYSAVSPGGSAAARLEGPQLREEWSNQLEQPERLHLVSNHFFEVDGDRAWGKCASIGYTRTTDGRLLLGGNCYEDEYVRTSEGWRFKSRVLRPMVRSAALGGA
jgi:hypothetical protein